MADPASYIGTKIASMIGGFIGGSVILTFIRPKTIGEAFTRGGTSVGSALIFSTPLLHILEWPLDWETQLMAGFIIGFVSYSVLGMIANFFAARQNKDIVEVVSDLKTAVDDLRQGKSKTEQNK